MELAGEAHHITTMIDITERKRAEERMLYQSFLLENINDAVVATDERRNITNWNRAAESMFGWSAAEALGQPISEIMRTEFSEEQRSRALKDLAESNQHRVEVRVARKDGQSIWVEGVATALRGENGAITGYVSINRDITERKRAEEALLESERRLRDVIANSPDTIYILDLSAGKMPLLNRKDFLGYSRAEMEAPGSLLSTVHPDDLMRVQENWTQVISGKQTPVEYRMRTKRGEISWVSQRTTVLARNAQDALVQIMVTLTDITERKRAEEALQNRYKELTAIYNASQRLQQLLSPNELAQEIIEVLEHTLNYTYGAVLLIDENGETLIPFALSRQNKSREFLEADVEYIRSQNLRLGLGVTGWVAEHGQSLRIGDVTQDPRYLAMRQDIRSEMCVPMLAQGRVIGVVNVETGRPNAFGEEDQRVLETIAAQISVAIQNTRLIEDLRLSRDRQADLSRRLAEIRESEARAIGRELHDQIGQMLTALKITLDLAPQLPAEASAKKIQQAQELTADLLNRVSRLSLELRPPMLDDLGLVPALLWHVNRWQEQTGIQVEFTHRGVERERFASEIETAAYRIVQESFTNVARHARATRVRLEVHERSGWLEIQIEDDGAGFDVESALAQNRGLSGMRERAQLAGGAFRVESQTGKGAKLFIELPLTEKNR